MLRITIDEPDAATVRVKLEGRIAGPWANELDTAWVDSEARRKGKACLVDVTGVGFIDHEGKRVISRLVSEGAHFTSAGPLTSYIIDMIRKEHKKALRAIAGR